MVALGDQADPQMGTCETEQARGIEWKLLSFSALSKERLYQLLRLRQEVFVVEQRCQYLDLDGVDLEPSTQHLFALDQAQDPDEPVAYLRIYSAPSARPQKHAQEVFRIGRVLVTERKRGLGIGRQMVQEAIAACTRIDPTRDLELSAQCYLSRFYQDFQFYSFGEPFDDAGIEHISMWRGPSHSDISLSRRS